MSILFAVTFTRYAAKRERSDLILALRSPFRCS